MVFIDTGAFLARHLVRDANHERSLVVWKQISSRPCFTSNHVIDETLTLLARRADYSFAAARAQNFYSSSSLEILFSTREDEIEAIRIFRKLSDQQVSFTDCTSFALMRRYGIGTAFSFDQHFARAGFEMIGGS